MLEDIRLGLKIWDNQNNVDTQTTDMRAIVYQTAADFEMRSVEHVRTLLSLIDKYKDEERQTQWIVTTDEFCATTTVHDEYSEAMEQYKEAVEVIHFSKEKHRAFLTKVIIGSE